MIEYKKFPNFETDRLLLRKVNNKDADFIYRLFSDERVCEFLYDEELFISRGYDLWHEYWGQ